MSAAEVVSEIAPLDLPDPVFMLSLYNEHIREGKVMLHDWQIRLMQRYAAKRQQDEIIRIALCANNGSGKSQFGVAPCAVWLAMTQPYGRSVITSASGTQLDRQTGHAISHIAEQVNKIHGPWWKINYRYLTFLPTQSTVELYATDEAGKAEGYHPHTPGGEFSIFVDEAKSVAEPIFEALMRCNGITRRLDVSSPGKPSGHFYNVVVGGRWYVMRVKASNCPHLNRDEIREARDLYGENSPLFRSMYLAEFTSTDEQVVIMYEAVARQLNNPPKSNLFGAPYCGLDLAAGGDENVLSVWQGNTQIGLECFRFADTTQTVEHLLNLFRKYEIPKTGGIIADDGGVGKAIIDNIEKGGYSLRRVHNQGKAINSTAYTNRGAELYFNFANHLPQLRLLPDNTQKNQLSSRYYRQSGQGKFLLESKREARAKGHGSPDRADATVLAMAGRPPGFFRDVENGVLNPDGSNKVKPISSAPIEQDDLIAKMDEKRYEQFGHNKISATPELQMLRNPQFNGSQQVLLDDGIYDDSRETTEHILKLLRRN